MFLSRTTTRNEVPVSATIIFPWVETTVRDSKAGLWEFSRALFAPRMREAAMAPTMSSLRVRPSRLSTTMPSWVTTMLPRTPGTSARAFRTLRTGPSHDLDHQLLEEGGGAVGLQGVLEIQGEGGAAAPDEGHAAPGEADPPADEAPDVHAPAAPPGDLLDAPGQGAEGLGVEAPVGPERREGLPLPVEDGQVAEADGARELLALGGGGHEVDLRRRRGPLGDPGLDPREALEAVHEGPRLLAALDEGLDGDVLLEGRGVAHVVEGGHYVDGRCRRLQLVLELLHREGVGADREVEL